MTDRADARPSGRRGAHCGGGPGGCCRARGRGRLVLGDVWRNDLPDVHTEHHDDNDDDYDCAIDNDDLRADIVHHCNICGVDNCAAHEHYVTAVLNDEHCRSYLDGTRDIDVNDAISLDDFIDEYNRRFNLDDAAAAAD